MERRYSPIRMNHSLALAFAFAALLPASVGATTALIDFGRADNVAPAPYNAATHMGGNQSGATTGLVPLNDTAGTPTGWAVVVTEDGSGNGGNAGVTADVTAFPTPALDGYDVKALQDSLFANNGGGTAPGMTVGLTGLDATATYDLLLYGSRANGQSVPNQIWHLAEGTGGTDVVHPSGLNATVAVDWKGIRPNAGGRIVFTIKSATPTTGGVALALNFASITENSSTLFNITSVVRVGDVITLTWNSREGAFYTVNASKDLLSWPIELDDSVVGDPGDETTWSIDLAPLGLANEPMLFLRAAGSP